MELQQGRKINVRDAVAIRQHEGLVSQPRCQPFEATTSDGLEAGIHEMDSPGIVRTIVDRNVTGFDGNAQISGQSMVVQEVALDDIALVSQSDDELIETL